jgi:cell division protein FtsB
MAKTTRRKFTIDSELPSEWIIYLLFLSAIALLYIYFSHRTDNLVRDIEKTKKNLVELRAENITLKAELIRNRSRDMMEQKLEEKRIEEPNRAIKVIVKSDDER